MPRAFTLEHFSSAGPPTIKQHSKTGRGKTLNIQWEFSADFSKHEIKQTTMHQTMFWLMGFNENIFHKQSLEKENIYSCFSELSFRGWSIELEHLSSDLFCWLPAHDHEQENYYTNFSYRNHRRGQITNCPGSIGCLYKILNWTQVFCIPAECLSK